MHRDSKLKDATILTDRRSRKPSREDQYGADLFLIKRVLEAYERCISLATISTMILNEDGAFDRQKTLLPGSTAIDYICDVQRLTARALDGNVELQTAWFALLEGQPIEPAMEHGLVRLLSKAYRFLSPFKYFQHVRRGAA